MSSDVADALDRAEDAFDHVVPSTEDEPGLAGERSDVVQLRKACRLLEACRTLRGNGGYYTSIIETSFAAVERSLEAYLLADTGDELEDFHDHEYAFERVDRTGLFPGDEGRRLLALYDTNRVPMYYQDTVPNERQAAAMFDLATVVHEQVTGISTTGNECLCPEG